MSAIRDGRIVAAVSEVSLGELDRQAKSERARLSLEVGKWFGDAGVAWPVPSEQAEFGVGPGRWIERIATGGWPSHEDLVRRELEGRRPFKENGTGYRDALIWHGLLEWMRRIGRQEGEPVLFVTGNVRDFAEKDEAGAHQLHPHLGADLREDEAVHIHTSPRDLHAVIAEQVPASDEGDRARDIASLELSTYMARWSSPDGALRQPFDVLLDGGASGGETELQQVVDGTWKREWHATYSQRGLVPLERLARALGPLVQHIEARSRLSFAADGPRALVRIDLRARGSVEVQRLSDGAMSAHVVEPVELLTWTVEQWDDTREAADDHLTFVPQE